VTEQEWYENWNPEAMLLALGRRPGKRDQRKFRLYACECVRMWENADHCFHLDPYIHKVLAVAEQFANGLANARQMGATRGHAKIREKKDRIDFLDGAILALEGDAYRAALWTADLVLADACSMGNSGDEDDIHERVTQWQAWKLRSIFRGNPFQTQPRIAPEMLAWNEGTVPKLAQTLYDERVSSGGVFDGASLAVLADALEEAGCTDETILTACRQPTDPHNTLFWMVDLLVGTR
jgi:hypothetical protein